MSNRMIHPWNCACVKQVLIGWKLIFGYKVQRQQVHRTVEQFFSTNLNPGYRMSPSVWLVESDSTVRRICCRWALYPKINFQPIRICLMHTQIRREWPLDMYHSVGHVSPCIVWICCTEAFKWHILKMGNTCCLLSNTVCCKFAWFFSLFFFFFFFSCFCKLEAGPWNQNFIFHL